MTQFIASGPIVLGGWFCVCFFNHNLYILRKDPPPQVLELSVYSDCMLHFGGMQRQRKMVKKFSGRDERNILFTNVLNTFYLQLYDIGHMVKDHSDS